MKETKRPLARCGLCLLLICALLISICPAALAKAAPVPLPEDKMLISQTDYDIAPGMTESQVIMNNAEGSNQVLGYMATISPGAQVTFKASYGSYYTKGSTPKSRAALAESGLKWDLRTTTSQAKSYEAATGDTVVTAINADYYNMQTGQCTGYLIMEGNLIQTGRLYDDGSKAYEPYFAVLKDGSYVIRDAGTPTDDVQEAISGAFYLVKNGEICDDLDPTVKAPRNSIGLKADGTVVLFMADGRQGVSNGLTLYEIAQMQKAQGVVTSIYLDGGGSATYASRHGGGSLEIQNHPSDGAERVVASSLLVVSTAKQTGKFDHAVLEPNNALYIAGAKVQFTASGVDAGGYAAEIPSGCKWALSDKAYGTIDASGLFQSNGTCGTVTVNLMRGDEVVGTTAIEVQEPDELYFASRSLNLSFKQSSDLGLTAKYKTRAMELGGYIFDWTITPASADQKPADIGTFDGNTFTAIKAKDTRSATVTVSYKKADSTVMTDTISLEIGRMPTVLFDFEPDAKGNLLKVGNADWGNASYGNAFGDENMELTYISWNDETNLPGTVTKRGPFTFGGEYISNIYDRTYDPTAYILGSAGYTFFTWHTSYMQENSAAAEIVSADRGQVRFGDYALRLDYDYTNLNPGYRNVNEYLYYCSTSEEAKTDLYAGYEINGTPSGLGVWIYAPEGTPNYWLWTNIAYYDANSDSYKRGYLHFKTQEGRSIQYNGIYWDGWMYCEADLTPYAQYVTPEHPLKLVNGMPLILMTFIPGGSASENGDKIPMGDFAKGSIYFDNFRLVYGDTVDDMDNPEITALQLNGTEAAADGSTVVTSSKVDITAAFQDPVNDNTTGINTEKTAIYVDGQRQTLTKSTEKEAAASVTLPNGTHSVTLNVIDGFGNLSTTTRYFTVKDAKSSYGAVVLTGKETAELGKDYTLTLTSAGSDKLSDVTAKIRFNTSFGTPAVTFPAGSTGKSTLDGDILNLEISGAVKSGALATVTFHVDPATPQGTNLVYSVEAGTYRDGEAALTFAQEAASVSVQAPYRITADIMTVGGNGKIYVTKADGSKPGKMQVYLVRDGEEDELVGTTNRSGILVTNRFCRTVGEKFCIYAKAEDGLSFQYNGTTTGMGSDEVTPTNVRLNAVKDPATSMGVSWFSAPEYTEKAAVVQYVEKSVYDSGKYNFTSVDGTCTKHSFTGDNAASQINTATMIGLKPGTTYCYRVGDGVDGHWSEIAEFTTDTAKQDTSFFILGDTQLSGNAEADAEDIATLRTLAAKIKDTGATFGLQTGDYIDNAGELGSWDEIQSLFAEEFARYPIVQVMGNHEYYGDLSGQHAETAFNLPDEDFYSVEYGNVYMAVINCNANLEAAAKWLVQDAAKSDCPWKVLTVHQPPYYTNPKGSSANYHDALPAAVDEAGIDFVFSGHDHTYARTEPLTGGKVDSENGAVYMICGDLGEKSRSSSYIAEDNEDFHFATIDQDYDAIYLVASTSGNDMTVTAYNVDGTVLDSYTMHHTTACERDGHKYVYDRAAGTLACSVCGESNTRYTGWATDSMNGGSMYFLAGRYKTGWFRTGLTAKDVHHFDEKTGIAHKVTIVEDVPTTCTVRGHFKLRCECGETYADDYEAPLGHHFEAFTRPDGSVYYVCSTCGEISDTNLPFIDLEPNAWYLDAVDFVYQSQYFSGTSSNTFAPNDPMQRCMLVSVLWRIAGKPDYTNTGRAPFTDSEPNSWYAAALNWAVENKIVAGYDDGTFRPKDSITREQIAAFLYRFAGYLKLDTTARANFASFADASQVSSYAKDAMSWAVASKLIYGKGKNNLDPRGTATRAEVAAFVMRFTKLMDKQAETTPEKQAQTEAAQTPASQVDPAPAEAPQAETDVPAEAAAPAENG